MISASRSATDEPSCASPYNLLNLTDARRNECRDERGVFLSSLPHRSDGECEETGTHAHTLLAYGVRERIAPFPLHRARPYSRPGRPCYSPSGLSKVSSQGHYAGAPFSHKLASGIGVHASAATTVSIEATRKDPNVYRFSNSSLASISVVQGLVWVLLFSTGIAALVTIALQAS